MFAEQQALWAFPAGLGKSGWPAAVVQPSPHKFINISSFASPFSANLLTMRSLVQIFSFLMVMMVLVGGVATDMTLDRFLQVESDTNTTDTAPPTMIDTPPPCILHKAKGCKTKSECCDSKDQCILGQCIACLKPKRKCYVSTDCCKNTKSSGCTSKGKCGNCSNETSKCKASSDCCAGLSCSGGKCASCGSKDAKCKKSADCCSGLTCKNKLCKWDLRQSFWL